MGVEVTDICMDKESDCVVVYSNGVSHDLTHETVPDHHDVLESYEPIHGELQRSEESFETKEYEVKECTTEVSAEVSEVSSAEKNEEHQNGINSKFVDGLQEEKVKSGDGKKNDDMSQLHVKHASKAASGVVRTKHTVPQPFALATEKRASSGNRPTGSDHSATSVMKPSHSNNVLHPNTLKQNQSLGLSRKPLQPNNKKHPDEEDNCSVTSITATSGRTKKSTTTAASAPVFRSSIRAEKRKEFYSKLEEKHQALEAEKSQSEARTKEEKEADIKQLRKSLLFKASPMPSFYNEGPPPKIELKKLPPTRAKSPKLGRRKSCGDTVIPSQADKVKEGYCGLGNRQSLGISIEDSNSTNGKDQLVTNGHVDCKTKVENEQEEEFNNSVTDEVNKQSASSIGVQC